MASRSYAERDTFVTTDGANVTDARTLAVQIGLAKAMRRYDLRRVVSFTLDTYAHVLPTMGEQVATAIEKAFGA